METGGPSEGSTCSSVLTTQIDAELQPSFRAAESRVTEIIHQFVQDVEARISASLKLAAAEVANHLGKEAVSRLVAGEKKVAFLEQELITTKEQALSMLLRLKHATDSQIFDLEKRLVAERVRAEEAEAKVSALQESLKRLKKTGKTPRSEAVNSAEDEDCLALIAGVACDVMHEEPGDKPENENESQVPEGNEETPDDPQSSGAQNPSGELNPSRAPRALAPITEVEDEENEPEDNSNNKNNNKSNNNSDTGEDENEDEANESGERRQSSRLRSKRRSREISTSEKLTRLMAGSKRARGKSSRGGGGGGGGENKDSKKQNVVVESSRDSRRLMQGARQLFSLAESKW